MSDMNWEKTQVFVRARLAEDGDSSLAAIAECILHILRVGLSSPMVLCQGQGLTTPMADARLEVAKNLTLELALLWHGHPDFPTCWERS